MLEGLDKIDWSQVGHVYSSVQLEIPRYIRALLSDDVTIREDAYSALYGFDAQEYGMLGESTLYIAPFFIELLEYEHTPDKATILRMLADWGNEPQSTIDVFYLRDKLRYIEILEQAEVTFLQLLRHPDSDIRRKLLRVLARFSFNRSGIIPAMRERFDNEPDELIKAEIIATIASFFVPEQWDMYDFARQYSTWFDFLIESGESQLIKTMAAHARIKCSHQIPFEWWNRHQDLDYTVPHLIEAFFETWNKLSHFPYVPLDPIFHLSFETILQDFASVSSNAFVRLLADPHLTPHAAHKVIKYLREHVFATRTQSIEPPLWGMFDTNQSPKEIIYTRELVPFAGRIGMFDGERKKLLLAITDCDPFWQIPTNLFSFFYGLPDEREELRKLVTPE